jgi:tol-pal system protein YbgF
MQQSDMTYVRSDIVRLRRDVESLKEEIKNAPAAPAVNIDGVLRNQASQRETLLELKDGQQRTASRIEEVRHELATLKQEITNLKLNLIRQMESMRVVLKKARVAPAAPRAKKPKGPKPGASKPKAPGKPPTARAKKPAPPIDYTKLYDTAYEDYQRQSYSLARTGFEEYLRLFPETDLADNAQYWVGECFYAEGKYVEASKAFKMVITRYPTGNKVPRAMLKAGHALLQLGNKEGARSMFQQVIDSYPLSSEADQAKGRLKKLE